MSATKYSLSHRLGATVWISALGYFVDIYDLLLFGIVRVKSLIGIGVPHDQLLSVGILLINAQMAGMLVGGIGWGIAGDKRGRVSVLFGSILIYSVANILNAYVDSVQSYAILRFLAGIGLAGELGAAITLVTETMTKESRGIGTTVVAAVGILGAVLAGIIGDVFDWRTAYLIGGGLGLMLLILRMSILESGMFQQVQTKEIQKGDLRMLFRPRPRFLKYLSCILVGVPIWYVIGILITFSPELARQIGVQGEISAGKAILFCYLGISVGDLASGGLSQVLRSRRQVIFGFLAFTMALVTFYILSRGLTVPQFYFLCSALGFGVGYWAVFMTLTAEQFGTNLRATAAITAPNFIRGSVVVLTSAFQFLQTSVGLLKSAWIVGGISWVIGIASIYYLEETFGRDLDYIEV